MGTRSSYVERAQWRVYNGNVTHGWLSYIWNDLFRQAVNSGEGVPLRCFLHARFVWTGHDYFYALNDDMELTTSGSWRTLPMRHRDRSVLCSVLRLGDAVREHAEGQRADELGRCRTARNSRSHVEPLDHACKLRAQNPPGRVWVHVSRSAAQLLGWPSCTVVAPANADDWITAAYQQTGHMFWLAGASQHASRCSRRSLCRVWLLLLSDVWVNNDVERVPRYQVVDAKALLAGELVSSNALLTAFLASHGTRAL